MHISGMDYPALLRDIMRAGKLNQTKLAKRVKVEQPTVSRWLKGSRPLVEQHERIIAEAKRLGVLDGQEPTFEAEAPDESGPTMVSVIGHTGANATASFYVPTGELDQVPAPDAASDKTVAVEIRGHSLGKVLDRALVFYDDVQRPITPALVGRLCVVGLADDRVLVKRVRRGSRPGLYTLISEEPPIEDVEIDWAAPVIDIRPR